MFFDLKKREVPAYTLKKYKRSKSIKLLIRANGELIVTAPIRISKKYIEEFVYKHSKWIQKKLDSLNILVVPDQNKDTVLYLKNKEKTRTLVHETLEKINKHYNLEYKKVFIRNQKTRWGSCSSKGNLNFSYKLALIEKHLLEYVVVHELFHLKEMNHGPQFWELVEETIPDYKKIRAELHLIKL